MLLLALAVAQIANPGFENGLAGWTAFGHRGFRAYVERGAGGHWLNAGWAARNRAPDDAAYRISTRIDARRYRGRRVRVSAATRAPEFAHRVSSLFASAGTAEAETRIDASETWRRHSLILTVPRNARAIEIGFRVQGTSGQLDADDVRVEILR